mmetsp:Transcript_52772/g.171689  ORF Transcript_52772/g.171689 Transcript_52772/m.171689 type:complete len:226 (+) Transcript_52772:450-1127(+)
MLLSLTAALDTVCLSSRHSNIQVVLSECCRAPGMPHRTPAGIVGLLRHRARVAELLHQRVGMVVTIGSGRRDIILMGMSGPLAQHLCSGLRRPSSRRGRRARSRARRRRLQPRRQAPRQPPRRAAPGRPRPWTRRGSRRRASPATAPMPIWAQAGTSRAITIWMGTRRPRSVSLWPCTAFSRRCLSACSHPLPPGCTKWPCKTSQRFRLGTGVRWRVLSALERPI